MPLTEKQQTALLDAVNVAASSLDVQRNIICDAGAITSVAPHDTKPTRSLGAAEIAENLIGIGQNLIDVCEQIKKEAGA